LKQKDGAIKHTQLMLHLKAKRRLTTNAQEQKINGVTVWEGAKTEMANG